MIYDIIDSHLVSEAEFTKKDLSRQLSLRNSNALGERIALDNGAHLDFTVPAPATPLFASKDGATPLPPIGFGQIGRAHV